MNKSRLRLLVVFYIGFSCLSILLLTQSCGSEAQAGNPRNFHEGNFKYADVAKFGDFLITRTRDAQVDSGITTQLVVKFDLSWEDDENYTLRFNKIVSNPQNIQLPDMNGMFRKCWMTEVTDTSYVEISTTSLAPDTIVTTIVKN